MTGPTGAVLLWGMVRALVVLLALAWRCAGGEPAPTAGRLRLVVLGDSIAAGFGVDPAAAFPSRLQARIDKAGLPFEVVNAGVSGDTTSGGLRRVDWLLKQPVAALLLELGGNDGLRGIPPSLTQSNLVGIIAKTRARYPQAAIVVAGMQMPNNLGPEFQRAYAAAFPEAAKATHAELIPFLLEGVGGVEELNQADQIHPNPRGHDFVAEHVWKALEPVLRERARLGQPQGAAPPPP